MEITFTTPKDITVVSERKKTVSQITIDEVVDSANRKTITAMTKEVGRIVLWKDAAYDAIGQWTDTDVTNRIKELYK